jgi:DNA-binding MarR family transcriptional regulator
MRRLVESAATPARIAEDAEAGIAHISRALQELREQGLVELLVSEERRKGRVYGLTEDGARVWEQIETENLVSSE